MKNYEWFFRTKYTSGSGNLTVDNVVRVLAPTIEAAVNRLNETFCGSGWQTERVEMETLYAPKA